MPVLSPKGKNRSLGRSGLVMAGGDSIVNSKSIAGVRHAPAEGGGPPNEINNFLATSGIFVLK